MALLSGLLRGRGSADGRFSSDALPDVAVSEWWTADRIAEYQAERARWIVAYAWDESPFYRDWMRRHGVRPRSIQGADDLRAIPPVSRPMVQAEHDRILVPDQAAEHALSGGTTGHRLRWARTIPWLELFTACLWRGFGWAGITSETRVVAFYSRTVGGLPNESLVIRGAFDRGKVEDDLRLIRDFRPDAAYTYASAAYILARYLVETGRTLPLRTVATTADTLFPEHRRVIESAFECRVFDNYGCNDGGAWGAECHLHQGFHQDAERAILQIESGRYIATDLWNIAFPFIRYENGDSGAWVGGDCACGRHAPRFRILGRSTDLLVTPTKVIFPSTLSAALLHEGLADARVVQRSAEEAEILLVPNELFDDGALSLIERELRPLFEGMGCSIRVVESIPPTLSGKHRVGVNLSDVGPESVWEEPGPPAEGPSERWGS